MLLIVVLERNIPLTSSKDGKNDRERRSFCGLGPACELQPQSRLQRCEASGIAANAHVQGQTSRASQTCAVSAVGLPADMILFAKFDTSPASWQSTSSHSRLIMKRNNFDWHGWSQADRDDSESRSGVDSWSWSVAGRAANYCRKIWRREVSGDVMMKQIFTIFTQSLPRKLYKRRKFTAVHWHKALL